MATIKAILDAGATPQAIVALKGGKWFLSARYPAHAELFEGLYHFEIAGTLEDATDQWIAWFNQQWSGL